jgi:hypothetical protein
VTEPLAPQNAPQPPDLSQAPPTTAASRLAIWQQAGGILVPILTVVLAFLIGGLVVLATGHDPIQAYWDIIKGAGLNWFAHPTNTDVSQTASRSRSPSAAGSSTSAATASTWSGSTAPTGSGSRS